MINDISLPRITVIICVKNSVKTIEKSIQSAINQSYKNLELIVIDSCSTDGTTQILNNYKNYINKFIVEEDGGTGEAYNKGIRIASNDIIGFLNADDFYEKGILQMAGEKFLENPNIDILSFRYRVLDEGNNVIQVASLQDIIFDNNLPKCLGINAKFFKKNLFLDSGFIVEKDDKNRSFICNDLEYIIRFKILGYKFFDVDWIAYNYLSHVNSLTFNKSLERIIRLCEDNIFTAKIFLNNASLMINSENWVNIFKKWKIKNRIRIILLLLKNREYIEAFKNYIIGLRENDKFKFSLYLLKKTKLFFKKNI